MNRVQEERRASLRPREVVGKNIEKAYVTVAMSCEVRAWGITGVVDLAVIFFLRDREGLFRYYNISACVFCRNCLHPMLHE